MTTKEKPITPLEELSSIYNLPKESDFNKIHDNPVQGTLSLIPAGLSHYDHITKVSRQDVMIALLNIARSLESEKKQYPYSNIKHSVYLQPDEDNEYDQNAIRVNIRLDKSLLLQNYFNLKEEEDICFNIGYIPQKISAKIKKHINQFKDGCVFALIEDYKVRNHRAKQLVVPVVELHYNMNAIKSSKSVVSKFNHIMKS